MELKLIILSLACFSLLMPPALGSLAIAKAAAVNALKGASLIGAGLALKGKAALLAAQGVVQLALKGAAMKDILVNAAAQNANVGALMLQRPIYPPVYYPPVSYPPVYYPQFPLNNMAMARPGPTLLDILSGVIRAVGNKVVIAGQVLGNMNCPPVVQYLSRPNLSPLPMMGCLNQFKRK